MLYYTFTGQVAHHRRDKVGLHNAEFSCQWKLKPNEVDIRTLKTSTLSCGLIMQSLISRSFAIFTQPHHTVIVIPVPAIGAIQLTTILDLSPSNANVFDSPMMAAFAVEYYIRNVTIDSACRVTGMLTFAWPKLPST